MPARGGGSGEHRRGRRGGHRDDGAVDDPERGRRAQPAARVDDHRGCDRLLGARRSRLGPRGNDLGDNVIGLEHERDRHVLGRRAHGTGRLHGPPVRLQQRRRRARDRRSDQAPGAVPVPGLPRDLREPAGAERLRLAQRPEHALPSGRQPRAGHPRRRLAGVAADRLRDQGAARPARADRDAALDRPSLHALPRPLHLPVEAAARRLRGHVPRVRPHAGRRERAHGLVPLREVAMSRGGRGSPGPLATRRARNCARGSRRCPARRDSRGRPRARRGARSRRPRAPTRSPRAGSRPA